MSVAPDKNVEAIRAALLERCEHGLKKYGVTTERTDLSLTDWLQHGQEEALDLAVYLERSKKMAGDFQELLLAVLKLPDLAIEDSRPDYIPSSKLIQLMSDARKIANRIICT